MEMVIELLSLRLNLEHARHHLIDQLGLIKLHGSSVLQKLESIENDMRKVLSDIEDALKKIDDGTYGICDECGKYIEAGRLEILPHTPLCLNCVNQEVTCLM